jgi:phage shock protein A
MKSLKELEVDAYLAGASVVADLYGRTEDAEANNSTAFISQLWETDKYKELLRSCEEELEDAENTIFKLKGRIEELEFAEWRLEQLEK